MTNIAPPGYPIFTNVGLSVPPASMTSVTTAITASASTVTLTVPSYSITILVAPGSSNLYIDFSGADATTGSFQIPAGFAFSFNGNAGIQTFSVIGDGTTGTYSVFAH